MLRKLSFILLVFSFLHLPFVEAQSSMVFLKGKKAKIRFELVNNLILMPVNLNGVELRFILDTGLDQTILFDDEYVELELRNTQKIRFRGVGNNEYLEGLKSVGNKLIVDQALEFSEFTCYLIPENIIDLSAYMGVPIHGMIGYDFFEGNLVEINYARKIITVYERRKPFERKLKRAREYDIEIAGHKPYLTTQVQLNDTLKEAILLLDLGNSNGFYLYEEFVEEAYSTNYIKAYLGQGLSGDIYGVRSRLKEIRLGGFSFMYPVISVPYQEFYKQNFQIPGRKGSIGGGVFKRFRCYFDYPEGKIYLKKNKYYADPFHVNMSGLEVIHAGMEWDVDEENKSVRFQRDEDGELVLVEEAVRLRPIFLIVSVREDSPADKAGIKAGDRVLRINHKKARNATLENLNEILRSKEGKTIKIVVQREEDEEYTASFELEDPIPFSSSD